jgi:hypothetical protein
VQFILNFGTIEESGNAAFEFSKTGLSFKGRTAANG